MGLDEELEDIPTAHLDGERAESIDVPLEAAPPRVPESRERAATATRNTDSIGPDAAAQNTLRRNPEPSQPVAEINPPPRAAPSCEVVGEALVERDISSGSLLCNRYVLGRVLGSGGGALIFQAEDRRRVGAEDFGSRIAIKVLRPEVRRNAHALTRLKREFRQMQRLLHPGIARVSELGCDEDVWFMTMELIDGQTINQWLKTSPSRAAALQVLGACCDALVYAHGMGIVHGDLKPSNVLVLADNSVKLVDFGSAAERDMVTGEVDKDRSFAATPPYASPQILLGDVADPRDDVFSLACLAYALLTRGEHPFERKSSAEARQAGLRPLYARALRPREFDVIVRGLAWEREQRPATVHEFLHALLASDWRREAHEDHGAAEVSSEPVGASTPTREAVAPQADPPVSTPGAAQPAEVPTGTQQQVRETIRAEDIARLKAALAAAEAHAERIEGGDPPQTTKVRHKEVEVDRAEPLARFSGYVAGPMAPHANETSPDAVAPERHASASDALQAAAKKSKRGWPWQRSAALAALLVAGASLALIKQLSFEGEPVQRAEARPTASVKAPPVLAPSTAVAPAVPTLEPPVPEKKSPPDVTKPKAPPLAPGEVSFATRTLQVGAGQTIAALTVKRTRSQRGRASVPWTIEAGTARAGVDYVAESTAIQFLDGQQVRSLFIKLIPDQNLERSRHSKTFTVKLQPSARGPQLGEINKVYVTIVGDVGTGEVAPTGEGTSQVSARL